MLPNDLIRVDSEFCKEIASIPEFTDIYIHREKPTEQSFVWPGPNKISENLYGLAAHVVEQQGEFTQKDFRISFHGHKFRVHKMTTLGGEYLVCRRMPMEMWDLDDCKMHPGVQRSLMSERSNKGGFMIVCGKPGNGKSTTCGAIITERLKQYGGLCLTIEDPAEMPLHGTWGEGVCLQREVLYEEFPDAIRDAMRAYPTGVNTIMLIGEIRDPETAALALQSAVDGRLVITSTHAGSPVQGIQRILSLAGSKIGDIEARHLLAASFRIALHQEIKNNKLAIKLIEDTPGVVGKIMGEPLEQLSTDLQQQMNNIRMQNKTELRKI
jgi:Tfp pilus assembly pilus retraction ATPase PilT